ncbi:hypothetical protein J2Z76_001681 [Sedimentibacter acidaminivorans]|uniref:Type I phosphodiesterase / nucleotide pyrophosphatase n=1 Tax=Sedimentibacter acidaminivorans TaxID=913099 RepID=A0ABS4GDP1_9FIRM|nr:alkaline phosphatase family protein [Sedimentibacter acidaminivorans]MBP1925820.1 hypothetical protein [Sedimentibacter acidaminivorans]
MNKNMKIIVADLFIIFAIVIGYQIFLSMGYKETIEDTNVKHSINIFDDNRNYLLNYEPQIEKDILLKSIVSDVSIGNITVIKADGESFKMTSDVFIGKNKDGVYCATIDKKNIIENIVGIYLSDNYKSITYVYYHIKNYIDNDKKLMVVLLDGFGYNEYKLAKEKDYIPFLSQYYKHTALSVYTPVTNAGYAAMITGQTPNINGVHDRSVREMNVNSIFAYALEKGEKAILLESDIKILNTEIEPILHLDLNKDSDTDDEMFNSCLDAVSGDNDLIFIHFHGIDDRGHAYGTQSEKTLSYINKVDGYIQKLSEVWGKSIILTADHGMHDTEDGGSHGECRSEDMIVPYFIIGE